MPDQHLRNRRRGGRGITSRNRVREQRIVLRGAKLLMACRSTPLSKPSLSDRSLSVVPPHRN
jgi:hypothetical protein